MSPGPAGHWIHTRRGKQDRKRTSTGFQLFECASSWACFVCNLGVHLSHFLVPLLPLSQDGRGRELSLPFTIASWTPSPWAEAPFASVFTSRTILNGESSKFNPGVDSKRTHFDYWFFLKVITSGRIKSSLYFLYSFFFFI